VSVNQATDNRTSFEMLVDTYVCVCVCRCVWVWVWVCVCVCVCVCVSVNQATDVNRTSFEM
jgi:hypothetical protein